MRGICIEVDGQGYILKVRVEDDEGVTGWRTQEQYADEEIEPHLGVLPECLPSDELHVHD